jgi:hypothetical protein
MHEMRGPVAFSPIDLREQAAFVPNFFHVRPTVPHGAFVIGLDALAGLCWLRPGSKPRPLTGVTVVGAPLQLGKWLT